MLASQAAEESPFRMSFVLCRRDEYTVYDLDSDQHFKLLGAGPVRSVNHIPVVDGENWQPVHNEFMSRAINDYIEASYDQESERPMITGLLVDTDRILLALLKMASILSHTLENVTDREDERVLCVELCQVSASMREFIEDIS